MCDPDGYDIVYVDFNNGTDYMQRNAYLLERVIRWVNSEKANAGSTQPNAMIAMSMGGLIAQYALCDIERDPTNTAYPHQVSLLITHDSPHQGANMPVGVQMAVRHLAGTVIRNPIGSDISLVERLPALGQARKALESPAAQQLLRYQALELSSGAYSNKGIAVASLNSLYVSFQQEYQALLASRGGTPSGTPNRPCRVVASSNGSECGQGQPYNPYDELAGITTTQNVANFPLLNGFLAVGTIVTGAGAAVYGAGLAGPVGIAAAGVFGVFALGMTGAYDMTLDFHIHALPDQQEQQIYSVFAQINKRTRLFGLFRIQFDLLDFQAKSNSAMLPLDSGSGGIISLADYAQSAGSTLPAGIVKQQQFAFVPTYSALNITPGGSAALRATYSPGTSVGTPFANFRTAARQNEGHLTYTALNSTWMLRELRQNPQVLSCAAFCQLVPALSGFDVVCTGESATYTVNAPANTVIRWNIQPAGLVSSSTSGNSITLTNSAGLAGTRLTIAATIVGDCGELAVPAKSINLGVPEAPALEEVPGCVYNQVFYRIANYDPSQTYTITNRVNANGPAPGATFWVKGGSSGSFTLTAFNRCGNNSVGTDVVYSNCASASMTYTVSPNPGTDEVTVEEAPTPEAAGNASHDPAAPAGISGVRVYDGYGRLRLEQAGRDAAAMRLRVSALPAGLYVVHILSRGSVAKRQRLQITR